MPPSLTMKPAFVMAMSAGRRPEARKTTTASPKPTASKPRKRVRVSELTRKYRTDVRDSDEALLISDQDSPPVYPLDAQRPPTPRNTRSSKCTPPGVLASARAAAAAAAAAAHPHNTTYKTPVRFSRFPSSWDEAVSQVSKAVSSAVAEGHDRIRVDVKTPELIADARSVHATYPDQRSRQSRRIALLVESANAILKAVFDPANGAQNPYSFMFTPSRAAVYFNSQEDADTGRAFVDQELAARVDLHVLGDPSQTKSNANVSVVIAPCNKRGNPEHIESVEMVHYSNWNNQKLVIMLNPDLLALTRYTTFGDEPRQPCFLTDYVSSYYIDPAAFPSKTATGAILRCFPRKWEMYLLKMQNDMGFRLVAEQMTPPSAEKIRCEFSWRIERELEGEPVV